MLSALDKISRNRYPGEASSPNDGRWEDSEEEAEVEAEAKERDGRFKRDWWWGPCSGSGEE